jgi:serine/threonine protein kinase
VAIKLIHGDDLTTEADRTRLMREISLLKQMNHPFIAKLFFAIPQQKNVAIVQEYASRGTLLEFLRQHGPLPEPQVKYYFLQILSAVDYLHNVRKVTHRDLKLENILLDAFNNVKVVDFGLGRTFLDASEEFTTPCGSPPYIAPEILSAGTYTREADIWALGIVLYALSTGTVPFYNENFSTLCSQILKKAIVYPRNLSESLIDLLGKMLCRNPVERISIEQIKCHPWFPAEQYAAILHALGPSHAFRDDPETSDPDSTVIAMMRSNGLDCSGLEEALMAGEESEMTILYQIYLRDCQADRVNRALRMSMLKLMSPREQRSLPLIRPGGRTPLIAEHQSQEWGKPRLNHQRPQSGGREELSRRVDRRILRRPGPVHPMRGLESIPRAVEEPDVPLS